VKTDPGPVNALVALASCGATTVATPAIPTPMRLPRSCRRFCVFEGCGGARADAETSNNVAHASRTMIYLLFVCFYNIMSLTVIIIVAKERRCNRQPILVSQKEKRVASGGMKKWDNTVNDNTYFRRISLIKSL
jgi:hypothetical protein